MSVDNGIGQDRTDSRRAQNTNPAHLNTMLNRSEDFISVAGRSESTEFTRSPQVGVTSGEEADAYEFLLRNCRPGSIRIQGLSSVANSGNTKGASLRRVSSEHDVDEEEIDAHAHGTPTPSNSALVARTESDQGNSNSSRQLGDFSGEMAARENVHFDKALTKHEAAELTSLYYSRNSPVSIPDVGKVNFFLPSAEQVSKLKSDLNSSDLRSTRIDVLGLQSSLISRWDVADNVGERFRLRESVAPLEAAVILCIRTYIDVLVCHRLSPVRENRMRKIVMAHCLSHTLRARSRVLRHDECLRQDDPPSAHSNGTFRDQGFSRARVLFLTPLRNNAYDVVSLLSKIVVGASEGERDLSQVANKDRFEEEFGPGDEKGATSGAESRDNLQENETDFASLTDNHQSNGGNQRYAPVKPQDWQYRFRGNVDDDFKLGIALTKKSVKLYSDFYSSDIIVASPLGIVRSLEAMATSTDSARHVRKGGKQSEQSEVEEWKSDLSALAAPDAYRRSHARADDDSFLSSVEICVIDGADVIGMQNWSTLLQALQRVNNLPSGPGKTDFRRVREWALDELMRYFRQTIVLSGHKKPEIMCLFRELRNHGGRVSILEDLPVYGSLADASESLHHRFFRIGNVSSPQDSPDRRFEFFKLSVLPNLRSLTDCQALLFVPSYFDFVRVRNMLVELESDDPDFSFSSVSEYSSATEVARARTSFFAGKVKVLALTERFHFYWRNRIRGSNTIVWYALPECSHFYPEIVDFTKEAAEDGRAVQSIALYDRFDEFVLERIVGPRRCKQMKSADSRSVYLFAS